MAVFDRDKRVAESETAPEWAHHFEHAFQNPESEQYMGDHMMQVMRHTVDGYNGLTHGPIGRILFVPVRKLMEVLRREVLSIIFIGGPIAWLGAAIISYILGRRLTR